MSCIVRQACLTHKPMMPLMPPIPAARHAHGANLANPTDATFFDPCHPSAPCSSCRPSQAPIPMPPNLPCLLCSHHSNSKRQKSSYFLETGVDTHAYQYMHRMPLDHMPKLPCHPCSHHSSYSLLKPPPMPTRPIPPVLPTPMPQYILVKQKVKPEDEDESPISLRFCTTVLQDDHSSETGHIRIP